MAITTPPQSERATIGVENQLGFKHIKWIREIEFVHDFRDYGAGQGGYNEDHELYGYRDEI